MKKIIAIMMAALLALSLCACTSNPSTGDEPTKAPADSTASATAAPTEAPTEEPTATPAPTATPEPTPTATPGPSFPYLFPYVVSGLTACYEGNFNTLDGMDTNSAVWKDLSGKGCDVDLTLTDKVKWTEKGLYVNSARIQLPDEWLDTINTNEFTVEFKLDDYVQIGGSFATFINSSGNDNFAFFIRTSTQQLEFKLNNAGGNRPVTDADFINGHTIAVTSDGMDICIYVDGELMDSRQAPDSVDAMGYMFIGHDESSKQYEGVITALRLYDRALSESELASNAKAVGSVEKVEIVVDGKY